MIDSRRIAKNTLSMYIRMLFILGVSLFTSRVVLEKLGVNDFALYGVVGGIVGMLSFLNGTLSTGTSRFIAFALGAGNKERLRHTFGTAVITHFILSVIIVIISETIGIWYVYNKLVVSPERLEVALIVFQISILTTVISIMQIPFTAEVMAHERMKVYAYLGIFEASAKLGIVYMLSVSSFDKLILYASLIAIVQIIMLLFWYLYVLKNFEETRGKPLFEKTIFKSILGFSGWNVIASLTNTLSIQGVLLLLNLFFAPFVVASQALANQISQAINQFVNNIRVAINPQVIKLYADGHQDESKKLILQSSLYTFDLLLLIGLPSILIMEKLMNVWLVKVPPYAVLFAQYVIVWNVLNNYNASFYVTMMASGRIKKNSFAAVFIGVGQFVIMYFLFKNGYSALWSCYMSIVMVILFSFIVKPVILIRDENYTWKEILSNFLSCIKVAVLSISISIIPYYFIKQKSIWESLIVAVLAAIAVLLSSYVFMSNEVKNKLLTIIKSRISSK